MVRARMARVALVAVLGLACGCSTPSGGSGCSSCSLTSRLTSLFRRNNAPTEVVGTPVDGPVIVDPGTFPGDGSGYPVPQSYPPPLIPAPRPAPGTEAQRMPYQP
jgi:hypothetical protein